MHESCADHLLRILLFFVLLFVLILSVGAGRAPRTADLVVVNGHILTMDSRQPVAQAMAIQGDRIIWTGSNQEAQKLFPGGAHALDLKGATVLPGIIDAHTHLVELGKSLLRLNLKDVATAQEAVERVKQKAASTAPDQWILGWGWDEGKWASHYPDNQALSAASPNNPVYLVGLHTFAAWANQRALQLSGITRDTRDPASGRILRDANTGEPTGIL